MAISSYSGSAATVDITGGVSISPIPAAEVIQFVKFFSYNGSVDMTVNGSSTPIDFKVSPQSNETYYIEHMTFGLDDGGTCPPNFYGGLPGLTNGTQIILKRGGVEYELINLKNNGDIALTFNYSVGFFENGKYMAFTNGFMGKFVFVTNLGLVGESGDEMIIRIRDNLTSLSFQRAALQAWRLP